VKSFHEDGVWYITVLMSRDGELRRHERAEKSSPIQIVWQDRTGADKFVNGKSLDISPSGMRVEVSEQIDKQTYVTVQCAALGVHGTASVRTCTRRGMKYILGLEFSAGLKWKPKS
jgi:hypothetical protein